MSTPDPFPPADAPRPRIGTACAVVAGCGLAGLVAVGVLIYLAVTLFNQLGNGNPEGGGKGTGGPRPGPVLPTQLARDHDTIKLRGEFDAVCRAAGGRYLVLRIPSQKQLAVFDPNTATVVKSLPLDEPNSLFAGTAAKLFVYRPQARRLERYDLVSWERERTAPKPGDLTSVEALLAGPGSDGPVLLVGEQSPRLAAVAAVDADTLKPEPLRNVEWRWPGPARVAHDGRVIGVAGRDTSVPPGGLILRSTPGTGFEPRPISPAGHVAPSPDGRVVYTAGGTFDPDGTQKLRPPGGYFYTLPTAHGSDLFVSLAVDTEGRQPVIRPPIFLDLAGDRVPVDRLPGEPPALDPRDQDDVLADLRVQLWPAAGLLAVLPISKKTIELYKVDVEKLLKKSGKEYLVIGSDPPTAAVRGEGWSYTPVVWSSGTGEPTVEVKGPPGMGATVKGKIIWSVPPNFAEPEVQVRVTATDGTGRTAEQAFRVVLTDAAGS
jgi:hypothetical protein